MRYDTPQEVIPDIKRLELDDKYRPKQLQPNRGRDGRIYPLNNISDVIRAANLYLHSCGTNDTSFKTHYSDMRDKDDTCVIPRGLHVFDHPRSAVSLELANDASVEIKQLFERQSICRDNQIIMINPQDPRRPTNSIAFYSLKQPQPTFMQAMQIPSVETPRLVEYIMIYCKIFMDLMGMGNDELLQSQLSLVYYESSAGLNPHIDSIHQFEGSIGPILTIAIGTGAKMFDMLPTLVDGTPVRIFSKPNQFTIMDGVSRIGWSHGLPWGYGPEQWTVAVKFPALKNVHHCEIFNYNNIDFEIPYYLAYKQ